MTFRLPRFGSIPALATAFCLLAALTAGGTARAQDEKKADDTPPPAAEAEPSPPPAPEPAAEASTAAPERSLQDKSTIEWLIESSGIFGFVIIVMSVTMVALVIRMFLEYRMKEAIPPLLVDRLDASIKERKFQEAYDFCKDDPSLLARLIRTGVSNLPFGRGEAKEAMNSTAEEITLGMERRNTYLATIGTLGPMIGLLGTVQGMIRAFGTLATVKGAQPDPGALAGSISLALVVTMEGLLVAVPAIFFFQFFRGRITYLTTESLKIAERTINAFWHAAKQNPAGAAAAAKPPTP